MYIAIAVFLYQAHFVFFVIYCVFSMVVAVSQSYGCVYWQCPYIGRFAPCAGGFCLPSSQIARWFKNARKSERAYNIVVVLAFIAFGGIIVLPVYFLYQQSVPSLLIYLGVVLVYAASFLWLICPLCATRYVCPGGQTSTKLRKSSKGMTPNPK